MRGEGFDEKEVVDGVWKQGKNGFSFKVLNCAENPFKFFKQSGYNFSRIEYLIILL
jgi:hypothetical protein